jgi:hypothetical protein
MEDEYMNVKLEDEYTLTNYDSDDSDSDLNYDTKMLKVYDFVMYKICPKNKDFNFCYIGKTKNFVKRKTQHIRNTTCENDKKHYHLKQYETIRNNGGWSEWEMVEIDKIYGKTNLEARMREQELIDENNANLNSVSAFVCEEEKAATKKACTEKYRVENKELLKEQTKKYKAEHQDVIAEQMKTYRAENKEKIIEKTKEYREKNKEKHQECQKMWHEKNKEILKEKRKIYEAKKKQEKLEQKQNQPLEKVEPNILF